MADRKPAVPADLGDSGKKLWRSIVGKYDLRADELRILRDACMAADIQATLEEDIAESPLKTRGSQGQEVLNDSLKEWRQYSNLVSQHLKKLALPDEAGVQERRTASVSESARAAARARWGTA